VSILSWVYTVAMLTQPTDLAGLRYDKATAPGPWHIVSGENTALCGCGSSPGSSNKRFKPRRIIPSPCPKEVCRLCLKAFWGQHTDEEINDAIAVVTNFPSALKVANAKAAEIIAEADHAAQHEITAPWEHLSTALHVLHRYDDTRLNEVLTGLVQTGSTQSEVARAMGWSRQRVGQRLKKS